VIVTEGAGEAAGAALAAGDACGTGVGVASGADCKTERVPVTPGNESINAISMKLAAAPMVIFAKTLAVPRGPNAVLERPPEKRSPALDLPGCSRIVTTSTTQANMNNPYRM
jgi:precorrin-6B methylase 1